MANLKGILAMAMLISCLFWPASSSAQVPEQVIIVYPAVEPQQDSLALSLFAVGGVPLGRWCFSAAVRYARREGTLGQY